MRCNIQEDYPKSAVLIYNIFNQYWDTRAKKIQFFLMEPQY